MNAQLLLELMLGPKRELWRVALCGQGGPTQNHRAFGRIGVLMCIATAIELMCQHSAHGEEELHVSSKSFRRTLIRDFQSWP